MTFKTDLSRLLRSFARGEDGATAIIVALLLPIMLGSLALVEAGRVFGLKNQLQATADAAAMASVLQVPVLGNVRSTALDFAHRNMPAAGQYGDVLTAAGVEMGHWDGDVFIADGAPGGGPANAVRVTTLGEMSLFFAAALRSFNIDVPTSFRPDAPAIALVRQDQCYLNGFVAGGIINMNSSNSFGSNFCVYGRGGVTMNSSNTFAAVTEVGMVSLSTLVAGGNNPGLSDALVAKDIAALPVGRATQLIDDLLAGNGPRPAYITGMVTVSTLPATLVAGTLYRVTSPGIELSGTRANIGVISDHPIKIKSNTNLRNVILASRQAVTINSNVKVGDANFCDTGAGKSLIISAGAVSDKDVPVGTNSNITLHGVQVVSDGRVEMNSNLTITGASIQSTSDIVFNSSFDVAGCPNGTNANAAGDGTLVAQLVD